MKLARKAFTVMKLARKTFTDCRLAAGVNKSVFLPSGTAATDTRSCDEHRSHKDTNGSACAHAAASVDEGDSSARAAHHSTYRIEKPSTGTGPHHDLPKFMTIEASDSDVDYVPASEAFTMQCKASVTAPRMDHLQHAASQQMRMQGPMTAAG